MSKIKGLRHLILPGLSRHFARWILLFGLGLAVVMSTFSVLITLSDRETEVRRSVTELLEKALPSISTSVYTIDAEQLKIQLDSLLFNPHIEFAQVTEIRANQKIYTNRGVVPDNYDFIVEMPLYYKASTGVREDYGQLSVIATFKQTYNEMLRSAAGLFLSNMLMVLLLIFVVVWLLRNRLLKHINHLATMHEDLTFYNLGQGFEFERSSRGFDRPDELDRLLISANICRRQFYSNMNTADQISDADAITQKVWDRESLDQIMDSAIARSDVMQDPFVFMLFQVSNEFDRRSDHMFEQLFHVLAKRCLGKVLQSRLIATVDENSVRIAQVSHNQFAILISKISNPTHCISIAERLLELFDKDIIIGARTISPEVSCGICICPHHGKTRQTITAAAEYALAKAIKKAPKSAFEIFTNDRY